MTVLAWLCLCITLGAAIMGLIVLRRSRRTVNATANTGFRLSLAAGAGLVFAGTVMPRALLPGQFIDDGLSWLGLLLVVWAGFEPLSHKECAALTRDERLRRMACRIGPGLLAAGLILLLTLGLDWTVMFRLLVAGSGLALVNSIVFWIGLGKSLWVPRNWAGILIRLAVVAAGGGFGAARLDTPSVERVLEPGETLRAGGYQVVYRGLQIEPLTEQIRKYTAWLEVKHGSDEHFLANAELFENQVTGRNHSRTRIHADSQEELRLLFTSYEEYGRVRLKVRILQQMSLVWVGGLLLLAGVALELFQLLTPRAAAGPEGQRAG